MLCSSAFAARQFHDFVSRQIMPSPEPPEEQMTDNAPPVGGSAEKGTALLVSQRSAICMPLLEGIKHAVAG